MIAIDTNVLVYAHRAESPFHERARERVRELAESGRAWGIPWPCVYEFLAIVTHPKIYRPPTPLERALEQVDAWLESPRLVLLGEGEEHWSTLRACVASGRVDGPRIHDSRIAALCMSHGVHELWSADRDFSRFAGLRVANPLVAPP